MRQKGRITLVTPVHAGDLERFRFQRESIERCGIDRDIRHVAIVDHEDLPVVRDVGYTSNLDLISTREVLPRRIEARRRSVWHRRRDARRYIKPRPLHGWMAQQLLKLASTQVVDTEGIVSLDCDTFFVRPIEHGDYFAADGRMLLFEEDVKPPAEFLDWVLEAMKALHVSLKDAAVMVYTFSAVPMHCGVIEDMKRRLERIHRAHWTKAMVARNVFEYSLHGVYGRFVDELTRVKAIEPKLTLHYWDRRAMARFSERFVDDVRNSGAKAAMVQGNMGLQPNDYRPVVEAVWDTRALDESASELRERSPVEGR
jgi:hypothetical protein